MDSEKMQSDYVERVSDEIISILNFNELSNSYLSEENKYGKYVLKKLYDIFVDIYGTDCLNTDYEVACVPSIIKPEKSEFCIIGITMIDIELMQRYGTAFFTEKGVLDELDDYMAEEDNKYMKNKLLHYKCWYTIYPDKSYIQIINEGPDKVKEIIKYCRNEK